MTTLEDFRSQLPAWTTRVEAWLDRQPGWFRSDPAWASAVYLLGAPRLTALGSMSLKSVEQRWIDWDTILARADQTGAVETVLAIAAYHLACADPGPALGLMLVFPGEEAFLWAHAASVLYDIVVDRSPVSSLAYQSCSGKRFVRP